eukprot:TRINITY_DN285_c1_g4_i1.p1 TRINITY_DN285_c1_g4~~TRINITY_DN285_c1_g4_i1.p1  ORF type:complete len:214 (-),score=96.34 TRINITY_DN285_c1_g4_i1:214-855(-)
MQTRISLLIALIFCLIFSSYAATSPCKALSAKNFDAFADTINELVEIASSGKPITMDVLSTFKKDLIKVFSKIEKCTENPQFQEAVEKLRDDFENSISQVEIPKEQLKAVKKSLNSLRKQLTSLEFIKNFDDIIKIYDKLIKMINSQKFSAEQLNEFNEQISELLNSLDLPQEIVSVTIQSIQNLINTALALLNGGDFSSIIQDIIAIAALIF